MNRIGSNRITFGIINLPNNNIAHLFLGTDRNQIAFQLEKIKKLSAPGVMVASPFPVISLPTRRGGAPPASRGADALADIAACMHTRANMCTHTQSGSFKPTVSNRQF